MKNNIKKKELKFIEEGFGDNIETDPFLVSNAETVLEYLGQSNQ